MTDPLISSLSAAVDANPDDVTLRLHLASLLVEAGRGPEAVTHLGMVLSQQPDSAEARDLMGRALAPADQAPPAPETPGSAEPDGPTSAPGVEPDSNAPDWDKLEAEMGDVMPPMFVDGSDGEESASAWDVEKHSVTLADVGGLDKVKERLNAAFLAPLKNPELRALYGKSLRGGLLMYGPPGCGKTFLAKAVAGELGASFIHVSLADVLDMYIGQSEQNVAELFRTARAAAPCVLFLDELDAIGQKRSLTRNSGTRTTVNQLLTELDGVGSDNEGVFILAATNHPWDVDAALRRPGRLDRTVLVTPPDRPAREAILQGAFARRPIERIDVKKIAAATGGFSGADLVHVVESSSENALLDSVRTGTTRMITMADVEAALREIRPSIDPWLETARNVALYANSSGEYDELADFLRKYKRKK